MVVVSRMPTLTDINRALDRLGVDAFIPRTLRQPGVLDTDPMRNDGARPSERRLILAVLAFSFIVVCEAFDPVPHRDERSLAVAPRLLGAARITQKTARLAGGVRDRPREEMTCRLYE